MTERENLPAKLAAQGLAATTEKRGSLVARGMVAVLANKQLALTKDNDALANLVTGVEIFRDGAIVGGAYIESGICSFEAYSNAMVRDLGDAVKPHLRAIYESVRHYPGLDTSKMTPASEVDALCKLAELDDSYALWQRGEMYSNGFIDRGPLGTREVVYEQNH